MGYRCVTALAELRAYLSGASPVAFDFETAPDENIGMRNVPPWMRTNPISWASAFRC